MDRVQKVSSTSPLFLSMSDGWSKKTCVEYADVVLNSNFGHRARFGIACIVLSLKKSIGKQEKRPRLWAVTERRFHLTFVLI